MAVHSEDRACAGGGSSKVVNQDEDGDGGHEEACFPDLKRLVGPPAL